MIVLRHEFGIDFKAEGGVQSPPPMKTVLLAFSPTTETGHALVRGVFEYAKQVGWSIHMINRQDTKSVENAIAFSHPIGCLVGGHIDYTRELVKLSSKGGRDFPFVYLDRDPHPRRKKISCVAFDSAAAGRMAANELMKLDLASYGYVAWPRKSYWSETRWDGFRRELDRHGFTAKLFTPRGALASTYPKLLGQWLKALPKPAGVFAAIDHIAQEIVRVAEQIGLNIPDDLALIGVDDIGYICDNTGCGITSIISDQKRGGFLAAKLLDDIIAEPRLAPAIRLYPPVSVHHRGSTMRILTTHPSVTRALNLIREKAAGELKAVDVLSLMIGSRRQAERDFRRATGKTVLEKINEVRLESIKELLSNPNKRMSEILANCLWGTPEYLRRFFLKHTGMTMTEWRKRYFDRSQRQESTFPSDTCDSPTKRDECKRQKFGCCTTPGI